MRIHVAESSIPSDLTTPTLGSNYGLDGFEDMQYGMGVLEGVLDPDLLPSPALPTGLSKGAADQLDLDGVIAETPLNGYRITRERWIQNRTCSVYGAGTAIIRNGPRMKLTWLFYETGESSGMFAVPRPNVQRLFKKPRGVSTRRPRAMILPVKRPSRWAGTMAPFGRLLTPLTPIRPLFCRIWKKFS